MTPKSVEPEVDEYDTVDTLEFPDMVNRPKHYDTPMGFQAIEICKHYDFTIGNALKYIFRAGKKTKPGEDETVQAIEDLEKAVFYLNYRIKELKGE